MQTDTPTSDRFRRRVMVELSAHELELLERLQARHGTKRSTVVAGLRALDRRAPGLDDGSRGVD